MARPAFVWATPAAYMRLMIMLWIDNRDMAGFVIWIFIFYVLLFLTISIIRIFLIKKYPTIIKRWLKIKTIPVWAFIFTVLFTAIALTFIFIRISGDKKFIISNLDNATYIKIKYLESENRGIEVIREKHEDIINDSDKIKSLAKLISTIKLQKMLNYRELSTNQYYVISMYNNDHLLGSFTIFSVHGIISIHKSGSERNYSYKENLYTHTKRIFFPE